MRSRQKILVCIKTVRCVYARNAESIEMRTEFDLCLKRWINTPAEAVTELQDTEAAQYFGANFQITAGNPRLALTA